MIEDVVWLEVSNTEALGRSKTAGGGGRASIDLASAAVDCFSGLAHLQGIDANPGSRRHEVQPVV